MSNDTTTKTRTFWDAAFCDACLALEQRTGKPVRGFRAYFPEPTGYAVQVGDGTPYVFHSAKAAVLKIRTWLEAPL